MKALSDNNFSILKEYIERAEELGNRAEEQGLKFEAYTIITANKGTSFRIIIGEEEFFCFINEPLHLKTIFEEAERYLANTDARKKARIEALRMELAELEGNE